MPWRLLLILEAILFIQQGQNLRLQAPKQMCMVTMKAGIDPFPIVAPCYALLWTALAAHRAPISHAHSNMHAELPA